jgi:2-phosphosulfolactate phosphatase
VAGAPWAQEAYGVRCDWGPVAAAGLGSPNGVLVIVDVLCFTTTVTVGVERGTSVYPAPWRDARAARRAQEVGAVLAVGRRETTKEHPWSLSPAALSSGPAPGRLVLPSPNGSTIAASAEGVVVAACLRNAGAVGAWLSGRYGTVDAPVTVVAAGERWPDGSLRPALEDLLGAGAVVAALARSGCIQLSPEAEAARTLFEAIPSVSDAVRACASGVELLDAGFPDDVEVAVELDVSDVVPHSR